MTIPYMREYVAGAARDPAEAVIGRMYGALGWYFRAIDEINQAASLDKGKVLWIMHHGPLFRAAYQDLANRIAREGTQADPDWPTIRVAGEIAGMIEGCFAYKKMRWGTRAAMLSDLTNVNADILAAVNWINANVPEWRDGVITVSLSDQLAADGTPVRLETTATIPLSAAIQTQIAAMRARFATAAS
jgi:hypothetical protein